MFIRLLKFLGVEVRDLTYEGISKTKEETGCRCCESFLAYGYDCICKEEQVDKFDDGTEQRYFTRGECSDWDCSNCH